MPSLELVPISALAEINPSGRPEIDADSLVSFIPMVDVSNSGEWTIHQVRRFSQVKQGYTVFRENDILFAKITPCTENGKGAHVVDLMNGIGFGSTEFHVLRPINPDSARYLYHWSQNQFLRAKAASVMIGSAGQQRVPAWFFDTFNIPRFPLPEQRRIAAILDAADEAIHSGERVIAKLRQVKAGALHDLLTCGVDAQGRLRDPRAHPEQFKDSPLGRIPREWETHLLDGIAIVGNGLTLGRKISGNGVVELPYLRVANVQDGYLDLSEIKTVRVWKDEVERYQLQSGDMLMTEGGDFDKLGRGAVWEGQIEPCLHQNHIFRVRANQEMLLPKFLEAVVQSPYGKQYFVRSSKQTTNLATINSTQLKAFPVICPTLPEQVRIVAVLDAHDARLRAEEAAVAKLRQVKTGLMEDLLTGRVRSKAL